MSKNNWVDKQARLEIAAFEAFCEAQDLKEYAMDTIDTYSNAEIAQMVREGILTVEEVEWALRRRVTHD